MAVPARRRPWIAAAIATAASVALVAGAVLFVRAGVYDVGADDPHLPATHALLDALREASIRRRAARIVVPADLASEARIVQGAGNYAAMCAQCHLAPGVASTELSRGLYPAPPDLTREAVDAASAFWVIKHGIKGSGMPAWGHGMDDAYIWNLAAFLQRLPSLDSKGYAALVARSSGHSHGGGEGATAGHPVAAAPAPAAHPHPPGTPAHDDAPARPHVDPPGATPHAH